MVKHTNEANIHSQYTIGGKTTRLFLTSQWSDTNTNIDTKKRFYFVWNINIYYFAPKRFDDESIFPPSLST